MGKIYLFFIFSILPCLTDIVSDLQETERLLKNGQFSSNLLQDHATMMTTRINNDETNDEHKD
jgi:hypothetical protein